MSDHEHLELVEATVARFLDMFEDDLRGSGPRPLEEYVACFPSFELEIGRYYRSLTSDEETSAPNLSFEAPLEIGGYLCFERLGSGAQGVVWKARCSETGDIVAVKALRGSFPDRGAIERLRREAILGDLKIPGLCRVRKVVDEPIVAIAMDFVPGENLATQLQERASERGGARPTFGDADRELLILRQLCEIVQAAHDRGIVHRDLKPSNVMVGHDERPVLLDLGVASATSFDQKLTDTGDRLGTIAYMAPEQLADPRVGPAADVWALGVCLYEIVTGRLPFQGPTRAATEAAIRDGAPVRPSRLVKGLSTDFDAVVETALRKAPKDRYSSAEELGLDIERLLAGQRTAGRRISSYVRLREWARREPALAASLAILVVVLVSATAVSLLLSSEARQEARAKEVARIDANRKAFESIVREGELHAQAGRWNDVLVTCQHAQETWPQYDLDVAVLETEALAAINDWPRLERAIADLSGRDIPDAIRSRLLLVEGTFRFAAGKTAPSGIDLIKKALETNHLGEADRCFARAMLTDNLMDAQDDIEQALKLDPGHQSAHRAHAAMLLIFGENEEIAYHLARSRARFAEDPITELLQGAIAFRESRTEQAHESFAAVGDRSSAEERELYEAFVGNTDGLWRLFERAALIGDSTGGVTAVDIIAAYRRLPGLADRITDLNPLAQPIEYRRLLFPPSLSFAMRDVLTVACLDNPRLRILMALLAAASLTTDDPLQVLQERQARNPAFWFARAAAHFSSLRAEEGCDDLDVALLLSHSRRDRRLMHTYGARMCVELLITEEAKVGADESKIEDLRRRTRCYLGEILEHDRLEPWHLEMLSVFAIAAEARVWADTLVGMRRLLPTDDPDRDRIEQVKLMGAQGRWADVYAQRASFMKRKPRRPDWVWLLDVAYRKLERPVNPATTPTSSTNRGKDQG